MAGVVSVHFEKRNLEKVAEYIKGNDLLISEVDEDGRDDIASYISQEINLLLKQELTRWGKKNSSFFDNIVHYPVRGVACTYEVGELPLEPSKSFDVNISLKKFRGDAISAFLYVYLV